MKTGYVFDPEYYKHDTGNHPENFKRLKAIMALLSEKHVLEELFQIPAKPCEKKDLELVHDLRYVNAVEKLCAQGGGWLDGDTYASSRSFSVARLAAGGLLEAVRSVLEGKTHGAFCFVRPPGHHAEKERGMGFCLFNNVAVAAKFARQKFDIKKILIVDWDLHHGNGTQNVFYDDPAVLYFSTHQYPFYPGTGAVQETGKSTGRGYTVNVPLPASCGDSDYKFVFEEILAPAAEKFCPELILVSAGFDAHYADPLGGMQLSVDGYSFFTKILKNLSERMCPGKIVFLLEGGYNLDALAYSSLAVFNELAGLDFSIKDPFDVPLQQISSSLKGRVEEVKSAHDNFWWT